VIWTQWHRIELILFGVCILSSVKSVDYYNPTDLWYEARKKADGVCTAYPTGGQDQQQQSFDQFECHNWSVQQSGFDPAVQQQQPQVAQATPPPSTTASPLRGAAGGAAIGAVGGAIGGDAGKGAAIGAGVGALGGSMRRNRQQQERAQWEAQQQQQQQAQQQRDAGMDAYRRAFGACMSARNYQVQ
jgi:hypothetical protein